MSMGFSQTPSHTKTIAQLKYLVIIVMNSIKKQK